MDKASRLGRATVLLGLLLMSADARADQVLSGAGTTVSPGGDPPLIVGGGYQVFTFQNPGSLDNEGPFTFTSSSVTDLKVTDVLVKGDSFSVYDNNLLIFSTPTVAASMTNETGDPTVAFSDPTYSHGEALLAAGSHSITIEVDNSPSGGGRAYLRADVVATPEPATLVSAGIGGLILLAGKARRRAAKPAA